MKFVIANNSASNPLTLDLSQYLDVQEGSGLDVAAPQFTNKVFTRSLLREGASEALEQLVEKELLFPLKLGPVGGLPGAPQTMSALATLINQINQIIRTPGWTASWQPTGTSQPTIFDGISGQLDVDYSFRKEEAHWTQAKLRLFTQPLGRAAGPRPYAAASAVGPLLMISPYASGGALAIGASTQGGVSGYGGQQQGASSGVFYAGSPSLAGDAPAQLQISYVGPLPNQASNTGVTPYVAVAVLPDPYYAPLITAPEMNVHVPPFNIARSTGSTAVASQYVTLPSNNGHAVQGGLSVSPIPGGSAGNEPIAAYAGQHRLLGIARASQSVGYIATLANSLVPAGTPTATVQPGDWGLYDLGTFSLRPSEFPQQPVTLLMGTPSTGAALAVDLSALIMLPDNATWFLNPTAVQPSQYGVPNGLNLPPYGTYTNTLLLDDTIGDQFIFGGPSQTFAPSPYGAVPSSARITQYARGLVPRPDPKNGLPIIAIVGVGQPFVASNGYWTGASQPNPQNLPSYAQVNVLERTRYILS